MEAAADRTPAAVGAWKQSYAPSETERVPCPLCGATASQRLAEEWSLGIVRCRECQLVYVSPRVRDPERNYWGDEGVIERKYAAVFEGRAPHNRDRNYQEHLATIRRFKPAGRLLDIGTHCGFFLRTARGGPWEIQGLEPSPTNAALARRKFGLHITTGYLQDDTFPPGSFDVVTLVDVFEHVTAPLDVLRRVRNLLAPTGIVFIKVPNVAWNLLKYRVLSRALRRTSFDIFDAREHVVHYSQATLDRMLRAAGLRPVAFSVPRPIQTGEAWKRLGRWAARQGARVEFALTGRLGPLATDIACVAERPV
jgi:2-polyprenyl-3-methyl-5-hydroxy-6-metoxy-1,4-benzoquinol methylase